MQEKKINNKPGKFGRISLYQIKITFKEFVNIGWSKRIVKFENMLLPRLLRSILLNCSVSGWCKINEEWLSIYILSWIDFWWCKRFASYLWIFTNFPFFVKVPKQRSKYKRCFKNNWLKIFKDCSYIFPMFNLYIICTVAIWIWPSLASYVKNFQTMLRWK